MKNTRESYRVSDTYQITPHKYMDISCVTEKYKIEGLAGRNKASPFSSVNAPMSPRNMQCMITRNAGNRV